MPDFQLISQFKTIQGKGKTMQGNALNYEFNTENRNYRQTHNTSNTDTWMWFWGFVRWQPSSPVVATEWQKPHWSREPFLWSCYKSCPEQLNRWPCHSLTESLTFWFWHAKSDPRDLWPLRHLIRVMRKNDLRQFLTTLTVFDFFLDEFDYFWQFLIPTF